MATAARHPRRRTIMRETETKAVIVTVTADRKVSYEPKTALPIGAVHDR